MHCTQNDHQSLNDSVAPLVDKTDILDGLLNMKFIFGTFLWFSYLVELMLDEHSSKILAVLVDMPLYHP